MQSNGETSIGKQGGTRSSENDDESGCGHFKSQCEVGEFRNTKILWQCRGHASRAAKAISQDDPGCGKPHSVPSAGVSSFVDVLAVQACKLVGVLAVQNCKLVESWQLTIGSLASWQSPIPCCVARQRARRPRVAPQPEVWA